MPWHTRSHSTINEILINLLIISLQDRKISHHWMVDQLLWSLCGCNWHNPFLPITSFLLPIHPRQPRNDTSYSFRENTKRRIFNYYKLIVNLSFPLSPDTRSRHHNKPNIMHYSHIRTLIHHNKHAFYYSSTTVIWLRYWYSPSRTHFHDQPN